MKPYGRFQDFYDKWGAVMQLLTGAFLIVVSLVLVVLAFTLAADRTLSEQQSRVACQRAREFGPPLGRFFASHHALSAEQLRDYKLTIPKHC